MPLPSSLEHINLWLLDDGEHWTIVDCGIGTDELKRLWTRVFDATLGGRPVRRVVATHMHSDHLGLAHWLCERFGAALSMSEGDYRRAQQMIGATAPVFGPVAMAHLQRHGVTDAALLDQVRRSPSPYPQLVPALPPLAQRLRDGDEIAIGGSTWRAIAGFGHAPEHMALYCASRGVLIAGDMLLPRISTYVGVTAIEPDANPLPQFLASIDDFLRLPEDTLVLPSHGSPFAGIQPRVAELHTHHAARLAEVRRACTQPRTAAELVPLLFTRPLDWRNQLLALGETLAHLQALADNRTLQRWQTDGVVRFVAAPLR